MVRARILLTGTRRRADIDEARVRTYLDFAGVLFVVLGRDERVRFINRRGAEILGYATSEELVGKNWFDEFIPERLRAPVREAFGHLIRGDLEPVEHYENAILTRSGEERIIAWHNGYIQDARGRVYTTISSGRDVTRQRQLEAQLNQVEKLNAMGKMAAGVAHDLQNMLFAIAVNSEVLAQLVADPELRRRVESIHQAADTANTLNRQLLTFAQRQPHRPQVLDLNRLTRELLGLLKSQMTRKIRMHLRFAADLEPVRADPAQMKQVVMNLVLNARDAMTEGGELTIATANATLEAGTPPVAVGLAPGRYVTLGIADTGPGMDEATLARVFEPFFTTKEKGTGLGLATVYGIIKQSQGHIEVSSQLGAGTRFEVYLPAA